ncbi:hypothetical protein RM844_05285 [Streptomyces sp. DSM 44915]|uniref:Uncharacterized protein n=1 Tax=Streptomyces chisholmiae TaxID=3075540 RepID=A0ABU2JLA9_9ACTN|nr:hypothetical protein [Streptomyces sp. DSM 44915]MDT0265702.1 hypothetical protein [Streptomyces sp. DSM 44915]
MARISRTLVTLTCLLGAAALGAPGTAAAAPAAADAETAYNTKTQELTHQPTPTMPESCVERTITLAAGTYDWGQTLADGHRPDFQLGAGEYRWQDCLYPDGDFYTQQTTLDPANPDWDAVDLTETVTLTETREYTWGSYLDPQF